MTNKLLNILMASVALIAIAGTSSMAKAGDYRNFGGSMKDPVIIPAPVASSGNCYLRGDTGYAFAGNTDTYFYSEVTQIISQPRPSGALSGGDRAGSWMFEVGVGCGMGEQSNPFGVSGMRADMTFGYRGASAITGGVPGYTQASSVKADVTTYTQMFNLYKDFNVGMGSFTPYLGVGIGMAYHQMDNVYVSQSNATYGNFSYVVEGDQDLNFAWSLMAGFSVDLRENIKFDLGYRYMDMGSVNSNNGILAISNVPTADPYLDADMTAHEIKFGLRYEVNTLF